MREVRFQISIPCIAVTTGKQDLSELIQNCIAVHSFVDWIQVREKQLNEYHYEQLILSMIHHGISPQKLIVNHYVDVAIRHHCFGVQLGYQSVSSKSVKQKTKELWVAASIHELQDVFQNQHADMLLFGHVYATASKPGREGKGLKLLKDVVQNTPKPVYAIGGITLENLDAVLQTGVSGIAVMSAIFSQANPVNFAKQFQYRLQQRGEKN